MQDLIEYIAKSLVDHPERVVVEADIDERVHTYYLTVDPQDMGKVIGRHGKVARAIRALLGVAATREGVRATLEIRET